MNMMRKNNNRNNMKHRSGGGGGGNRGGRYQNNGGGNRGANDGQNLQRTKHHATQQREKYSNMARDAQNNGDRVDVEYYLQHVDHYTRVLADIAVIEAERFAHQREQQIVSGGPNDPNANHNEQAQHDGTSAGNDSANQAAGEGMDVNAEFANQNQPRMTRQRRRQHQNHGNEPQPSGNGAKEANSNTTEIPLPGSILPPI
jgi:hypothetical protein